MQALIDFIIRNLLAVWPIVQVDEWQAGMMVRKGRIHRPLGPGLHWRWLFIEKRIQWPRSEVVISLPTSSITTADGKAIALDANIGYRLVDIIRCWRNVWNLERSIAAAAAGIMCTELATRVWADLQGPRRSERERELRVAFSAMAETFGVEIVRVHLVACVEARQHRHFVDGSLAR